MTPASSIPGLERRLAAAPSSPLFARLAHALLASGETLRAEALCARGLADHPHYATGRLVRARVLAARGKYLAALDDLAKVSAAYPGNILLAELEEEWKTLAGKETEAVADDGAVFVEVAGDAPGEIDQDSVIEAEAVEVSPVTEEEVSSAAAEVSGATEEVTSSDEGVSAPVETASAVGHDVPDIEHSEIFSSEGAEPPLPVPGRGAFPVPILPPIPATPGRMSFIEPDRIVSRTLAEIYASQGAIAEAVETYRLLLDRLAGGNEPMADRLRELEERLKTDPGGPRRPLDE